jgi:hypothetical protein
MIGFTLRKTFYDLWDNMFKVVIFNLGFIAVAAIPIFLPSLFFGSTALMLVIGAVGILICSVYLSAVAFSLKSVSDHGPFTFTDFLKNIKTAWPAGIAMGIFIFLLFLVATEIIPFYLGFESVIGLGLAAIVFWAAVFALLSFQFYFTVYARLGASLTKSFKKCMIISLDNTGFAIFSLLHNIVILIFSLLLAFMFPGPVGALLYLDQALRLRLLKYDWLEANPGADRKKIPWDELLIEEREKIGIRSFRNFIFPWKD